MLMLAPGHSDASVIGAALGQLYIYLIFAPFSFFFFLLFLQDNKFGYFGITLNHQPDTRQYVLIRYC